MLVTNIVHQKSLVRRMTSFLGIIIFVISASFVNCERRLRFMPNEIDVWTDNSYVNFTYTIDTSRPGADLTFNVLKEIKDVEVTIDGSAVFKGSDRFGGMGRTTFSLCRLIAMRNANGIAMFIYAQIKSHGRIPEQCPIKKGVYKLQRVWVPEELIPSTFPELSFDIKLLADAVENGIPVNIFNASVVGDALYKDLPRTGQRKLPILIGG